MAVRNDFTIRAAAPGDEDVIATLNALVQELHLSAEPRYFKPTTPREVTSWFRSRLEDDTTPTWLAEAQGDAIGYLTASLINRTATPFSRARRYFELDQIAVHPEWRRRGVARSLFERLLDLASKHQVTSIEVSTWAFNTPAREAFLELGFQPMTTRYSYRLS